MTTSKCPICSADMPRLGRYPLSICRACATDDDIKDVSGHPVKFVNIHAFGSGFASFHTIDGICIQKEEHICFVKGVKCYAEEGYFGGIVIQIYVNEEQCSL